MAKSTATKKNTKAKKTTRSGSKAGAANQGKCTGWEAWEDQMPPGPSTLHVTGKCRFPTHGYKVKLKKAVPQGINPSILLLNKVVTAPSGPVIQVPEVVEVNYKQRVKKGQYKKVTILPEGKTIRVKIVS
jgi:hypothetical protein